MKEPMHTHDDQEAEMAEYFARTDRPICQDDYEYMTGTGRYGTGIACQSGNHDDCSGSNCACYCHGEAA